jgi:transcription antitermination factor NusG
MRSLIDIMNKSSANKTVQTTDNSRTSQMRCDFKKKTGENTNGKKWFAVHTRSRHEKLVDKLLSNQDVESFLPLLHVHSQWKDRKKWVDKPLFPGYLFVRIDWEEMSTVRQTKGIVSIIGFEPGKPAPVPEKDVENIRKLVESKVKTDPYPYLKPGQEVSVRRGPLRGVTGTIVRKGRKSMLVISVPVLGRSVAVEINAEMVQGL